MNHLTQRPINARYDTKLPSWTHKYPTQNESVVIAMIKHTPLIEFPITFKNFVWKNPYKNWNWIILALEHIHCHYKMWFFIWLSNETNKINIKQKLGVLTKLRLFLSVKITHSKVGKAKLLEYNYYILTPTQNGDSCTHGYHTRHTPYKATKYKSLQLK